MKIFSNFLVFLSSLFLFLIQFFIFTFFINFAIGYFSFAPFVPTKKRDLKRVFELANLKEGELVYELGSGDGRFLFEAVKKYKVKGVGVEILFHLYLWCLIKRFFFKDKKNIQFKWGNLYEEDISKADVIYFWGMPKTIEKKLKKKLEKEAKKGCKIISYVFEIPGWKPEKVSWPKGEVPIYLYIKNHSDKI